MHPHQRRLRDRRFSTSDHAPAPEPEPGTDPNAVEIPPLPPEEEPPGPMTEFKLGQIAGMLHESASLLQMGSDLLKILAEAQTRGHRPIASLQFGESCRAAAAELLSSIIEAKDTAADSSRADADELPTVHEIFEAVAHLPAPWEGASPLARIRSAASHLATKKEG